MAEVQDLLYVISDNREELKKKKKRDRGKHIKIPTDRISKAVDYMIMASLGCSKLSDNSDEVYLLF